MILTEAIRKAQRGGRETRTATAELRAMGDEFALIGTATLFNNMSHNLGGFRETIKPGTFSRSLKEKADVKCLFNHQADNILGRSKSGTLTLFEDARGLQFRCELDPNNSDHKNLYSAVKRGDIDECSFAFTVPDGGQKWEEGFDAESGEDCMYRTLTDVDLLDVSLVTYPAYPNTNVNARNRTVQIAAGDSRIAQMRRLAQSYALASGLMPAKRDSYKPSDYNYPPYNYASLDQVLSRAAECCEAAFAMSSDVADALAAWDEDDSDRSKRTDANSHKAFSESHAASHDGIKEACNRIAATRMALMRCVDKKE
jgi:uncharacterized protein